MRSAKLLGLCVIVGVGLAGAPAAVADTSTAGSPSISLSPDGKVVTAALASTRFQQDAALDAWTPAEFETAVAIEGATTPADAGAPTPPEVTTPAARPPGAAGEPAQLTEVPGPPRTIAPTGRDGTSLSAGTQPQPGDLVTTRLYGPWPRYDMSRDGRASVHP